MERSLYINAENKNGKTTLHFAAKSGHIDVVKDLLKKSTDVNAKDSDGNTPLHLAAIEGHIDVVETLLKIEGIDVNSRNKVGWTVLFSTIFCSYQKKEDLVKTKIVPVIRALLKSGASPLLKCNGNTPISLTEVIKNNDIKHFLEEEAKKIRNIIDAACDGNTSLLDSLLKEGVNVNTTDERGNTILHFAAIFGRKETVEFLLKNQEINVNAKNKDGYTPLLYCAAIFDHTDIIETLLTTQGIDVNAKNNNGNTPLDLAVVKDRIDVVEVMKNKGNSFKQQEYRKDIVAVSAIAILGVTIAVCLFVSGVVAAEPISIMLAVFSIVVVSLQVSGITHDIIRKMEDNLSLSKNAESKDPLLSKVVGSDLQSPIVNSCCDIESKTKWISLM